MSASGATARAQSAPPGHRLTAPRLLRGRALRGCNVHHHSTVFVQGIDLRGMAGASTRAAGPEFPSRFIERFAGLDRLVSGGRLQGGFLERLNGPAGVPLDEALLEAILVVEELAARTMHRLDAPDFAAIVPREASPAVVDLVWECHAAGISRAAAVVALAGLLELFPAGMFRGSPVDFAGLLARLRRRSLRRQWTTTAAVLIQAARRRGLPCEPLAGTYLRLGDGATQQVLNASAPEVGLRPVADAPGARPPRDGGTPSEAHAGMTEHRLLVVDGRVVSVLRVDPPEIVGDGRRTVAQLVQSLNDDPLRDGIRLCRVEIDEALRSALEARGSHPEAVPEPGERILLDAAATLDRGGVHTDVTGGVHPDYRDSALAAAGRLRVAAVDLATPDIARSPREAGGGVTRVRSRPELLHHALPGSGEPRDVGGAVLDLIFPPGVPGVVPTGLILGERRTSSIARELDGLLRASGRAVGLALRSTRTRISGEPVDPTSLGRRGAARFLLRDPRVECLVAAMSPRSVVERGLRLDRTSTTAILDPEESGDPERYRRGIHVAVRATSGPIVVGAGNPHIQLLMQGLEPERLFVILPQGERDEGRLSWSPGCAVVLRRRRGRAETVELRRGRKTLASVAPGAGDAGPRRMRSLMYATALAFGLGLSGDEIAAAAERRRYLRH
ncbi:MAG: hypothetical protein ACREAA_18995 [Candidatus Polarisedimenticolia bacterium]